MDPERHRVIDPSRIGVRSFRNPRPSLGVGKWHKWSVGLGWVGNLKGKEGETSESLTIDSY